MVYAATAVSQADLVMGDVIDAFSRAFTELNATALLRSDLAADQKAAAIGSLVQPEAQLEGLATQERQMVLNGTMTLDLWLGHAQMISDQLQGPASMIDPSVGAWISGVVADARGTPIVPAISGIAIALGLAGAAFIGYKLLKK